jgi:hypothetical protein
MTTSLESIVSSRNGQEPQASFKRIKWEIVVAASAFIGGAAAAWWYRNTLLKLRQGEETGTNPDFGMHPDESADDSEPRW